MLGGAGGADSVRQEFSLPAPIDGEVVVRNISIGSEVQGTYSGASAVELFTIGELDRVWVLADLFEIDLGKVKQQSHVTVKVVSYPEPHLRGRRRLRVRHARSDIAHGQGARQRR